MLLTRTLEEKLVSLYRGGQITGGVYIGKGQEAVSVACGLFLEKGDIFAPLIRDQAGRSAFGEPLVDVTRTYLGSRLGPMRGRDGNIHRGHPRDNELAMISHLGAMVSVTVGTLMAKRFQRRERFCRPHVHRRRGDANRSVSRRNEHCRGGTGAARGRRNK